MTAHQLILLRHGLTDWNHARRFQGQADVPLNEVGLAQAATVADKLLGQGIARIFSSDLQRAAVTAQSVAARLDLPVQLDPRLQEINVGTWAGLTPDEVAQQDPDLWEPLRAGQDGRHSSTGETATGAGRRVAAALTEYAENAVDGESVLVVGHGLTTRVASLLLMGLDYGHAWSFEGLGNCHWLVLRPAQPHWRLVTYNRS
ncbi:MAG: histidine phosphatase family protein [Actinobacteria bacterium HGW-Actinobacteria-2]|nr:MAG: histidine phosphatase family protein [Actinobacteria bacterium HGW-Actinobacteria-2]